VAKVADADAAYLYHLSTLYSKATGGRQIFFDILTDDAGKTWFDLGADSTPAGKLMQTRVNNVINYQGDAVKGSDPTKYKGPLVQVLGAAVAKYRK